MAAREGRVVALCGGVGGAKLALGLARALPPGALAIVVNTGDDFEHLGLHVSPDIDTVIYTLAGLAHPEQGWGRAGETWSFMAALEALGGESWFRLGDSDLAMHVERTRRLRAGESLSAITADIARRLGISARILPMSDEPVRTVLRTADGDLPFQHYFVRLRCAPAASAIAFAGADAARPSPAALASLADPALAAVVICPSNPYLSVDPILAVPGLRDALARCAAPVVAVSPIVGGKAVKGPAAKLMAELGAAPSALSVARHYEGLLDGFVLDRVDEAQAASLGLPFLVTETVMRSLEDRVALAGEVLDFTATLRRDAPRRAGAGGA